LAFGKFKLIVQYYIHYIHCIISYVGVINFVVQYKFTTFIVSCCFDSVAEESVSWCPMPGFHYRQPRYTIPHNKTSIKT
jgi:hypothetical protein